MSELFILALLVLLALFLPFYAYLFGRGPRRGGRSQGRGERSQGRGGRSQGRGGQEPELGRPLGHIHMRMPSASSRSRSWYWPPSWIKWNIDALALELHCVNTTILRFETEIESHTHSIDRRQFLMFEKDRLCDRRNVVCRLLQALERAYTAASQ